MKWVKRLKWLRISKIVIPVALAVSLVFAGFTVYGSEAENFVINAGSESDVKLSLGYKADGSDATSRLVVPAGGSYKDATFTPTKGLKYDDCWNKGGGKNATIPDDIAALADTDDGTHSIYDGKTIVFYSFSFYLFNYSERAVDIDMSMTIDEVTPEDSDITGAVRIMLIEGSPLLSDDSYTVYKKAEKSEENQSALDNEIKYGNVVNFVDNEFGDEGMTVFDSSNALSYTDVKKGESIRFTIVLWLEGWDAECTDDILGDRMKMHIDFVGS